MSHTLPDWLGVRRVLFFAHPAFVWKLLGDIVLSISSNIESAIAWASCVWLWSATHKAHAGYSCSERDTLRMGLLVNIGRNLRSCQIRSIRCSPIDVEVFVRIFDRPSKLIAINCRHHISNSWCLTSAKPAFTDNWIHLFVTSLTSLKFHFYHYWIVSFKCRIIGPDLE